MYGSGSYNEKIKLIMVRPYIPGCCNPTNYLFVPGDEIFSVNGRSVAGLTHQEAIHIFKEIKIGTIQVTIGRREPKKIIKISENL